jgi:beta-lactamase class A
MTACSRFCRGLGLALVIVAGVHLHAEQSVSELLLQKTQQRIRQLVDADAAVVGVAFTDLTTGRRYAINGDVSFPQASAIKIPIMMRVFQAEREGRLKLSDAVKFQPADLVGGSGNLKKAIAAGPLEMPLIEVVTAMIEHSDNSATNKCIALVGMERVNRMLDEMGYVRTRLRRVMIDSRAVERGLENISTPNEMALIAENLWRGRVVDEAASRAMLEILKKVKGPMREALPAQVESATKTGGVEGVRCESGVIFVPGRPFALSVMSTFTPAGKQPITDVTRLVYESFATLARSNEWGHAWKKEGN